MRGDNCTFSVVYSVHAFPVCPVEVWGGAGPIQLLEQEAASISNVTGELVNGIPSALGMKRGCLVCQLGDVCLHGRA